MREPLARQLVFTAKAMRDAFEDSLSDAGGSMGTWAVLSAISSEVGFINQSVLASKVRLEGAQVGRLVISDDVAGRVVLEPDPDDV